MAVAILCPNCGVTYSVADEQIGQRVRCKECQAIFTAGAASVREALVATAPVPEPTPVAPPPVPKKKPVARIPLVIWLVVLTGVFMSCVVLAVLLVILVMLWEKPEGPRPGFLPGANRMVGMGGGMGAMGPNVEMNHEDDEPSLVPLKAPEAAPVQFNRPAPEMAALEAPPLPVPLPSWAVMLHGRPEHYHLGTARVQDQKTLLPITLRMSDPLGRVSDVAVEVWTGNATPRMRPPAREAPQAITGDSALERIALQYQDQAARGELSLPALPPGKAYWMRPSWNDVNGQRCWGSAVVVSPEPGAVAAKPMRLLVKHQVGSRSLAVASWQSASLPEPSGRSRKLSAEIVTGGLENVQAIDAEERARVRWQFQSHKIDVRLDGQPASQEPALKKLRDDIGLLAVNLQVDRQGTLTWHGLDTSRLPPPIVADLSEWEERAALLELLLPPLPDKEVLPNETWQSERGWSLLVPGVLNQRALVDLSSRYSGTRIVNGRQEAVIDLEGVLRGPRRHEDAIGGWLYGTAVVDCESGQITRSEVQLHWKLEVPGSLVPATGKCIVRLQRSPEL